MSVSRSTADVATPHGIDAHTSAPPSGSQRRPNERARTFVQDENVRLAEKRAREAEQLSLPCGQRRAALAHGRVQPAVERLHKRLQVGLRVKVG